MKIAIYGQNYKNTNNKDAFNKLLDVLKGRDCCFFVESNFLKILEIEDLKYNQINSFNVLDKSFNYLISIGGDGTILRAITFVRDLNIPIVGINTGRLGFLATVQTNNIKNAITSIFNKDYTLSERALLEISVSPNNKKIIETNFALNEITISRKNTTSMITVETHLNNEYLTSYWADGLILATPTGSTGYSLSCGGPVISPNAGSLVLTPIAPHNLNARPLVIPDETKVKLKVNGRENEFLLSLDSRLVTLRNSTVVTVKKADFKVKLIEFPNESFIDTLRKKMLWGEDKRN